MSFCPNCKTTLIPVLQEQIKTEELSETPDSVSSSQSESENKKKPQVMSTTNKYVFRCFNCGYTEQMEPGILLLSRAPQKAAIDYSDPNKYKDMMHDKTLPHTRNYVCPNETCISHTDHVLREAVWFKPSRHSYSVVFICKACSTMW